MSTTGSGPNAPIADGACRVTGSVYWSWLLIDLDSYFTCKTTGYLNLILNLTLK